MTHQTHTPRMLDRIVFGVLGTALFCIIAFVPPILTATFAPDSRVRMYMYGGTATVLLLIWAASKFVLQEPTDRS